VLLQVERELPRLIRQVYVGEHGTGLFKEQEHEPGSRRSTLAHRADRFAQAAKSTYQGRLFAQDALQGLAPDRSLPRSVRCGGDESAFRRAQQQRQGSTAKAYPRSKNDLLAIFVERGLELLRAGGRIGAITSRTCFFLSSYQKWREAVVLGIATPEVMADLGHGVMDDAMVEAAAYSLAASC
jgi:hypothetical protein